MQMSGEKQFWLLRRLSKAFSVAAWIVLGLVVVVTPVAVARAVFQQNNEELEFWLTYAASGLLIFINLIWVAQSIQAILAIEENTRHTAFVLEKLTTLVQQVRDRLPEDPKA
jgi:cytochrome c biogenesis protein CcdA